MENAGFGVRECYLSACALSATELTMQKRIDIYQIGQKLDVAGELLRTKPQQESISMFFINMERKLRGVCIIARDGIMLLKGAHGISQMSERSQSIIYVSNSVRSLHEQLFEVLTPRYHFTKKTLTEAVVTSIVPEVMATTDRQSFSWLSCCWS